MTQHRSGDHGKTDAATGLTGWVVYRPKPWHFVGVFGSREEAELRRERTGPDYQVEFGTADVESGEFDSGAS